MFRPTPIRTAFLVGLAVALLAPSGRAQLQIGDNLRFNSNGSIGFGYSGVFSNYVQSAHATFLNASGSINGSYYNPNFLSFTVQPYYGRGQESVQNTGISNSSGYSANIGIFNGTRFPGTISFSQDFNSMSESSLPGLGSIFENGSGSAFGVSWAARFKTLPSLAVSYMSSNSDGDAIGSLGATHRNARIFRVLSSYRLLGWRLAGSFDRNSFASESPGFILGARNVDGISRSYTATASHDLPLNGSVDVSWMRTSTDSGAASSYTSENSNATASITPFPAFSVNGSMHYTRNLAGAMFSQLGGTPLGDSLIKRDSDSYGFSGGVGYTLFRRVHLQGYANHTVQNFMGRSYTFTQYGGSAAFSYTKPLFGLINFNVGVSDTASQYGNQGAGLVFSAAARRFFGRWETNMDFSYFQQMQTLVGFYTTSNFTYGGSIRRRLGQITLSTNFRATHSGLSRQPGSGNHGENISGSLGWHRYSVNASYNQSSGHALFTTSGNILTTPLASILTTDTIEFLGRTYTVSGGGALFRRWGFYGGFTKSLNRTEMQPLVSAFVGTNYSAGLSFSTRRLLFKGSFGHFQQGVQGWPFPQAALNGFNISVSRSFNFF